MSEKIEETLRNLAAGMSRASSQTTSSIDPSESLRHNLAGDPECPHCGGLGYTRQDLPVGHPDFGKLQICTCRAPQINQQVRQRLFKLSNLEELQHLTFENFNLRGRVGLSPHQADSIEQAYNQAFQFSKSLNGWLLILGKYGCGKTHLAAAIANFVVSLGVPTLFITVPDLLDSLRFAYSDPDATFEERFDEIRQSPLLILDDFGTQNATAWAQEKLFQVLNYRYINQLPLVVTSNLSLAEIEPRIRSRLQDPELVTVARIQATDYRRPTEDTGEHELSPMTLLHEKTFATFDLRKGENLSLPDRRNLEKAFNTARAFAEDPQGWLVLLGDYACGKTHLAAAIANYRKDLGLPQMLVVVPDLLDYLRATFNPASSVSLDRRFEEIRTAPLLILDDLGTQSTTPWAREKLYQLFNYRYNAELPTVITTANKLEELDPRLRSRMLDTRFTRFAITVPGYRGAPR